MARSTPSRNPSCPEETLYVELLRVADLLSRQPMQLLKTHDLSPNQYNVLRILRGAPEGLLCGEIGQRMISRDPDITRLLDRLEKRGLITRCRGSEDRRRIRSRITREGLALLQSLDQPVQEVHRSQLGYLGEERLRSLIRELRACHPAPA